VDLGPFPFDPGVLLERRRRLDLLEPEQLEEADRGLDIGWCDLDPYVLEHDPSRNLLSATFEVMEAMVAERGAEMTEWNDGLDDLSERVDRIEKKMDDGFTRMDARFDKIDGKFDRIDERFDEFFFRMDAKFDAVNERFEGLHRMLFKSAWALAIGLLGMLSVLIGVIATQS
jgi:hypothetical protein